MHVPLSGCRHVSEDIRRQTKHTRSHRLDRSGFECLLYETPKKRVLGRVGQHPARRGKPWPLPELARIRFDIPQCSIDIGIAGQHVKRRIKPLLEIDRRVFKQPCVRDGRIGEHCWVSRVITIHTTMVPQAHVGRVCSRKGKERPCSR